MFFIHFLKRFDMTRDAGRLVFSNIRVEAGHVIIF